VYAVKSIGEFDADIDFGLEVNDCDN